MKNDPRAKVVYETENIEISNRVQSRYKQQVLAYYGKEGNLKNKSSWINRKVVQELRDENSL